jgi:hypothetical protein
LCSSFTTPTNRQRPCITSGRLKDCAKTSRPNAIENYAERLFIDLQKEFIDLQKENVG